jgi:hypothetical protein
MSTAQGMIVIMPRRIKMRTAQLSNWMSCGGRMEYHAMVQTGVAVLLRREVLRA